MMMIESDFLELKENILKHLNNVMHTPESITTLYLSRGMTHKRCRWDVMSTHLPRTEYVELIDKYYKYLNDTHIDTALRKIMKHEGV